MSTTPLSAEPPAARIAAAVASAVSPFTSQQIVVPALPRHTRATACADAADPAPITTTTLSSSRNMSAFTSGTPEGRGRADHRRTPRGRLTAATAKERQRGSRRQPATLGSNQTRRRSQSGPRPAASTMPAAIEASASGVPARMYIEAGDDGTNRLTPEQRVEDGQRADHVGERPPAHAGGPGHAAACASRAAPASRSPSGSRSGCRDPATTRW